MKMRFLDVSEENSRRSYMQLFITVYICVSKNIFRETLAKTLGEPDVVKYFHE